MKMTEQETASSLFDEVKKLQSRVAFLEAALDQAIDMLELKILPEVPLEFKYDGRPYMPEAFAVNGECFAKCTDDQSALYKYLKERP